MIKIKAGLRRAGVFGKSGGTKMSEVKNGRDTKKVGDQRSPLQFYNVTL